MAKYSGSAVTDADREAAAAQLREHFTAGRLSLDEFQDRLDAMSRMGRRIMLAFGVATAGSLLVLTLLVVALMIHGGLFGVVIGALLAILAVGVTAVAFLMWLTRRLWRRHAWIEAVPLVAGQPWLSQVARMARLLLTGHALWRLRNRLASRV